MALTARLQFGDNSTKTYPKEFLVENCRCHFSRHYDLAYPDTHQKWLNERSEQARQRQEDAATHGDDKAHAFNMYDNE